MRKKEKVAEKSKVPINGKFKKKSRLLFASVVGSVITVALEELSRCGVVLVIGDCVYRGIVVDGLPIPSGTLAKSLQPRQGHPTTSPIGHHRRHQAAPPSRRRKEKARLIAEGALAGNSNNALWSDQQAIEFLYPFDR